MSKSIKCPPSNASDISLKDTEIATHEAFELSKNMNRGALWDEAYHALCCEDWEDFKRIIDFDPLVALKTGSGLDNLLMVIIGYFEQDYQNEQTSSAVWELIDLLIPLSDLALHSKQHERNTVLHYAASLGNARLVDQLIQAGADPNALNLWVRTPLMLAAEEGHLQSLPDLVAVTDLNQRDSFGASIFDILNGPDLKSDLDWLTGLLAAKQEWDELSKNVKPKPKPSRKGTHL